MNHSKFLTAITILKVLVISVAYLSIVFSLKSCIYTVFIVQWLSCKIKWVCVDHKLSLVAVSIVESTSLQIMSPIVTSAQVLFANMKWKFTHWSVALSHLSADTFNRFELDYHLLLSSLSSSFTEITETFLTHRVRLLLRGFCAISTIYRHYISTSELYLSK